MNKSRSPQTLLPPAPRILHPRRAFTLVELLDVITIIGILTALIVVAAVGALKTAQQTRIKVELDQISDGIQELKNKHTAYPPNCQTDGTGSNNPLDETQVLNDLKRYLKMVAPRHREPDDLLLRLVGLAASGQQLDGGMTAGEAVVFWLGGISSDPKYPISGEGGPSYRINSLNDTNNRTLDPISSRTWVFPFAVERLGPRADDEYFDESDRRFIEYQVVVNGSPQFRRINFWQYLPAKSQQPYLYFDTSRHPAYDTTSGVEPGRFDPPAATASSGVGAHIHAFKKINDTPRSGGPIQFVDPSKFQVLHCGIDDTWDTPDFENFERMSVHAVGTDNPNDYLLFPTGPFTGDIADTVVNFATQNRLEDAQTQ
jgi:prepilin-type N-terminal cleavage/methylation domain-containing protein